MTKENVHVIIRFRPKNKREKKEEREQKVKDKLIIFQNNEEQRIAALEICGTKSRNPSNFTFDHILNSNESQANTFYHVAESVCDDILDGYNGCIFAYGQTGSGKTYTMFGPEDDHSHPQKMGIIPRSISYIFSEIEEDPDIMEARIKVSFVEIYKEKLRCLINPSSKKVLSIRLQPNGETRIANVTETHVLTLLDVLQLIEVANSYRTKAETSMNHSSSRSHMLMTLTVALRMDDGSISVGKLNFCDLAGSEKVRKTNATGNRLKEAQKINLSLTILGQVISALAQNKTHVPFRDSKLTHVLKDSLGGNCKTTLIVNCSKSMFNRDETINALRFGSRCKLITNNVKVNKIYSNAELMTMITKLRRQNTQLSDMLKNKGYAEDILTSPKTNLLFSKKQKGGSTQSNYAKYNTQENDKLKQQIKQFQSRINKLDDKNHYLQLQNNKLQEKIHTVNDALHIKDKQATMLNSRLTDYQARAQQLNKDINFLENETQQLKLKNKSLQNRNNEYKMEITDITKDRYYKTSKLNTQLSKFKNLHNDAMEETTELMDEVLKLKQSLDKSDILIEVQDHQLIQKRQDINELEKDLLEKERRVSNIFKEKMSLQTQFNQIKTQLNQYKTKLDKKDDEIERLKDELEERTQKLEEKAQKLSQKLEQREMIQHSYSIRSNPEELQSISPNKKNTAMLNTGIVSTKTTFPHLLGHGQSDDLLIHSASIHSPEDVINAEQSLLAQHDYLQKMATERFVERNSTGTYSKKRRQSKLVTKKQRLNDKKHLNEEKKTIEKEIEEHQIKLDSLRKVKMPKDKQKRLNILLEIATLEDDTMKLQRKLQNIDKQMSKSKKSKGGKESKDDNDNDNFIYSNDPMISQVTTIDAMNYIDAALTLSSLKNDNDEDYVFDV